MKLAEKGSTQRSLCQRRDAHEACLFILGGGPLPRHGSEVLMPSNGPNAKTDIVALLGATADLGEQYRDDRGSYETIISRVSA